MNKIRLDNKEFYYQVFYKNNKNMYLRVKDGIIVVTCNRLIQKSQIENFILSNQSKILAILQKLNQKEKLYHQDTMMIFGTKYTINFQVNKAYNSYKLHDNTIDITFKGDCFNNLYIEKIYQELLLKNTIIIYQEELPNIEKYFDVSNITFKTQLMKSRFGSCIAKKRIIKLNSILARFDKKYTRTILLHELIHLKEHNHQKGFYSYIDELMPNYKIIIRDLNRLTRKYVI